MAKTLGTQLDEVQDAISRALNGHRVEIGDKSIEMSSLSQLQKRESWLLDQIAKHGRDYVPGSSSRPLPRKANIVFG